MKTPLTRFIPLIVHADTVFRRSLLAVWCGIVLAVALPSIHAAGPPEAMAYQGFLVDANGNPLAPTTPANYPVIFRIFATPTGGASLWSEQQIVTVDKGNFSVILGEGTSIGEAKPLLSTVVSTNGADRYIELAVVIGNPPAVPMLPRLRLLPTAYAFLATSANNLVSPSGVPVIKYANNRVEVTGDVSYSGGITGNGSGLTGLTAAQIGSGTIADARLSANVALRLGGNTFTGNQTISGSLGIGGAPVDAVLDVEGPMHLNLHDLYLREGADRNHGLGYYGPSKLFAGVSLDGPVLYGWTGGALATKNGGDRLALRWDNAGRIGIGNSTPARLLHIGSGTVPNSEGMIRLESRSGTGTANRAWDIGVPETDEVITGSGYSFVIDDTQLGTTPELMVKWGSGDVGIGTTNPAAKLDVNGSVRAASVTANSITVNGTISATTFTGTFNGEKPPVSYSTGTANLNQYRDFVIDGTTLLGDADGGRIKLVVRHHGDKSVRIWTFQFYSDVGNLTGRTSAEGISAVFLLPGSGESVVPIGQTPAVHRDLYCINGWMCFRNYRHPILNGGANGAPFGFADRYKFYVMADPNISITAFVYDR